MKRMFLVAPSIFVLLFCFMVSSTWAGGRQGIPTSKEVSERSKGATFDSANAATAEHNGKKFKFTPAKQGKNMKQTDVEDGCIVGVVENGFTDISMPPGIYNIYMAKVANQWKAYAVQDGTGNIVAEAKNVSENKGSGPGKPKAWRGSGCWWMWLIFTGFQVCW